MLSRRVSPGRMVNTGGPQASHSHLPGHHACLTGCALTYSSYRRSSRNFNKGDFGIIKENEEETDSIDWQAGKPVQDPESSPVGFNKERRRSSFSLAKLAPPPPDPVEGTWKLIQCENYEKYLEKIGTGPLSVNMVMRANVVLTITQEVDKHWRIISETSIKAKSVRGYSTYNRKLTSNKWMAGNSKPELVEDWDQRLLLTTLTRLSQGNVLQLTQIAQKDQKFCLDSTTTFKVDSEDEDILDVSIQIDDILARRRFRKHINLPRKGAEERRHSIC